MNVDDKRGFRLIKDDTIEYHTGEYKKDVAEDIFEGDLLKVALVGGEKVVSKFAPGDGKAIGVAAHTVLASDSKNDVINVYDDPRMSFRVQVDTFAQGQEYLNADIAAVTYPAPAGSQSLLLEQSNMALDSGTLADTAALPLKVLGLARSFNNDSNDQLNDYGANADVIVKINNHVLGQGDGSTGIA